MGIPGLANEPNPCFPIAIQSFLCAGMRITIPGSRTELRKLGSFDGEGVLPRQGDQLPLVVADSDPGATLKSQHSVPSSSVLPQNPSDKVKSTSSSIKSRNSPVRSLHVPIFNSQANPEKKSNKATQRIDRRRCDFKADRRLIRCSEGRLGGWVNGGERIRNWLSGVEDDDLDEDKDER